MRPGTLLFKPGEQTHWNTFDDVGARTLRVEWPAGALADVERHLPGQCVLAAHPRLADTAAKLRQELWQGDELSRMMIECLLADWVGTLTRAIASRLSRKGSRDLAHRCFEYLEETFREPVGLAMIAEALQVERTRLARVFRETFQITIGEQIRRLRVEWVKQKLERNPACSLADLALDAGFADQSHMTRTFKQLVGESPGQWRRQLEPLP